MTRSVLTWLERSAQQRPQAIAFEDDISFLTYAGLQQRAQEVGSHLCSFIPQQQPVLIMMDKGPSCVAAMLGTVYAGCFYTPVDPSMPDARIRLILSVLQPACILCSGKYMDKAQSFASSTKLLCMEEIPQQVDRLTLMSVRHTAIDTDLLYVLFTRGSTGLPKGVAITHRSVIDFVEWACDALDIRENWRFGNQAPLYFDNSVLDLYCAIRTGACVHFIPQRYFTFPAKMATYLAEQRITTLFWVPSALTAVANTNVLAATSLPDLKQVFFCGEVMPCRTLNLWRKSLPEARYVNMYGPTEITDVCTWFPVDRTFADTDVLPIGFPCANTRIHLIDGEICVSGTCLSLGYYNAPDKTEAVFVPNPLRPQISEIIYRTGDLGEYNDRGELMFLGRRDSQIKRSGYRIELGEIECALCAQEGVSAGCCSYDAHSSQILCWYTGEIDEKPLRRLLKERLPKYMLPDELIHREHLPLTGSGKIDREQLKQEWLDEHPVL